MPVTNNVNKDKGDVIQGLEDTIAEPIREMFESTGRIGKVFAAIAVIAALARIFVPDLDKDLEPLLGVIPLVRSFRPASLISITAFFSATAFFLLVFISLILSLLPKIFKVILSLFNRMIVTLVRILYVSRLTMLAKKLNRLAQFSRKNIFFKDLWLAKSQGEFLSLGIPFNVGNFNYAKCNIRILKTTNGYWRAGIFFGTLQSDQYIFHLYEDHEGDRLKTRIVWRTPKEEKTPDSRKIFDYSVDTREIKMELKKKDDRILLIVDNMEIDQFKVPLAGETPLLFAAWADRRPFEIQMSDLEVVA